MNIDTIKAPTSDLEEWYLAFWKEWIIEKETKTDSEESFIHVPQKCKNNPDNHLIRWKNS